MTDNNGNNAAAGHKLRTYGIDVYDPAKDTTNVRNFQYIVPAPTPDEAVDYSAMLTGLHLAILVKSKPMHTYLSLRATQNTKKIGAAKVAMLSDRILPDMDPGGNIVLDANGSPIPPISVFDIYRRKFRVTHPDLKIPDADYEKEKNKWAGDKLVNLVTAMLNEHRIVEFPEFLATNKKIACKCSNQENRAVLVCQLILARDVPNLEHAYSVSATPSKTVTQWMDAITTLRNRAGSQNNRNRTVMECTLL